MKIHSALSLYLLIAFFNVLNINTVHCQTQQVLYGMTSEGGQFGLGTIFKYYLGSNTLVTVHDFDTISGGQPDGSLVLGNDGNLYGFTGYGGANNQGVIFQYNPTTNTYTKEIDLSSPGVNLPVGWLTQLSNGKFYGVTVFGGANSDGDIYEYDPVANTFTDEHDFNGGTGGLYPFGGLTLFNNKLYGANAGAVYSFDPVTWDYYSNGAYEGNIFYGGLAAVNGQLYGMEQGGALYKYDTSNYTITVLASDSANGGSYSHLVLASTGKIFGMTGGGGTNASSTIFQFDTATNLLTTVYNFDTATANGLDANAALMPASDSLLYGMTSEGGDSSGGVIFSFNPNTYSYTKLFDFNTATGTDPLGNLIEVTENVGTGVRQEAATTNISLYPNPATTQLTMQMPGLVAGAVANITDMTGRIVMSNVLANDDRYVFDIGTLTGGLYLVTVKQNGLSYTGKFVKGE